MSNTQLTIQQSALDTINEYHRAAKNAAAQMATYAVLAGLELIKLKKQVGHNNFTPFIEQNLEFGERTARRYMALADGVKNRAALKTDTAVSVLELLEISPSELDKDQSDRLCQLIHKVTDGGSISQLYLDFGITKAPQGSGAVGGGPGGRKPGQPVTQAEAEEALRLTAREQWALIDRGFYAYEDKFKLLGRAEVEAQAATLEIQLKARKAWLAN
jgi:hypothetical protein